MSNTNAPMYFSPYKSDSEESDYETESSISSSDSETDLPQNVFQRFITGAGSQPLNDVQRRVYDQRAGEYAYLDISHNIVLAQNELDGKNTKNSTTLIMIDSRDRDTKLYPQPSEFYIRLPRVYKNITNIAITHINLLCSFFYFNKQKGNLSVRIQELGRRARDNDGNILQDSQGRDILNPIDISIRQGTYSADDLVSELEKQLNKVPLFADIADGRDGFIVRFQANGDFDELFNSPGKYTFNSITGEWELGLTKDDLRGRYFIISTTNVNLRSYTTEEALVAYYYPMLREMILDDSEYNKLTIPNPDDFLNAVSSGLPTASLASAERNLYFDRVVYGFTGLSDSYVYNIISRPVNQSVLEDYRDRNTFNYFLTNNYRCSYNDTTGRFRIWADGLSKSIVDDISTARTKFFYEEILKRGITFTKYEKMSQNKYKNLAIDDMWNFLHRQITNFFGVDFGKYARDFFADSENEITIYDVSGATGYQTSYNADIVGEPISTTRILPSDETNGFINLPVKKTTKTFASTYLDPSGCIIIQNGDEFKAGYVDEKITISPTEVVRLQFKSRCRQNISIMTLPDSSANELYIDDDRFFDLDGNNFLDPTDIRFYMYKVEYTDQDYRFVLNNDNWKYFVQMVYPYPSSIAASDLRFNVGKKQLFLQLTPIQLTQEELDGESEKKRESFFYMETNNLSGGRRNPISTDLDFFFYRDHAAFMLDVNKSVGNPEYDPDPKNYFVKKTIFKGSNNFFFPFDSIENDYDYFIYIRTKEKNFPAFSLKTVFSITDQSSEINYPLDARKLPFGNELYGKNPTDVMASTTLVPYYLQPSFNLGYNIENVSNDFIDYFIRSEPNVGYDPANYASFYFVKLSESQKGIGKDAWFYSGSENEVYKDASRYLNDANASDFALANNSVRIYRIINPYCVGLAQIDNPEKFVVPREQVTVNPNNIDENYYETYYGDTFVNTPAFNANWDKSGVPNGHRVNYSPLYVCDNTGFSFVDVSYNSLPPTNPTTSTHLSLGPDGLDVAGFTFTVPRDKSVKLKDITIKFAYIDPQLPEGEFSRDYERHPEHKFLDELWVYPIDDVVGKDIYDRDEFHTRLNTAPIAKLMRTRLVKVGNYTISDNFSSYDQNFNEPSRERQPEWGTYYTYTVENNEPVELKSSPLKYDENNNPIIYDLSGSYIILPIRTTGYTSLSGFYGLSYTTQTYFKTSDYPLSLADGHCGWMFKSIINERGNYEIVNIDPNLPVSVICKITFTVNLEKELLEPITEIANVTVANPYTDTRLFFYDDSVERDYGLIEADPRYGKERADTDVSANSLMDLSGWGCEKGTIFKYTDDDNGYYFLSFINNIPVRKDHNNIIHIRAYVPSVQFNTAVRVVCKNWTDFGTLTLKELAYEIFELSEMQGPDGTIINDQIRRSKFFSKRYANALINFNNAFKINTIFGTQNQNIRISYFGEAFNGTGQSQAFGLFLEKYRAFYNSIITENEMVTAINAATEARMQKYLIARYGRVLPTQYLTRAQYEDPVPFRIEFKSSLVPPFSTAFAEWGLGWNLGFDKVDTEYKTLHVAQTFIRIIDDFIYLRLNQEQSINTLDLTEKEDNSKTQETVGQSSKYFAKIVLRDFGDLTDNCVIMPKVFQQPLAKLEKFKFQLVDRYGTVIDNNDCDFSITMQITEQVAIVPK